MAEIIPIRSAPSDHQQARWDAFRMAWAAMLDVEAPTTAQAYEAITAHWDHVRDSLDTHADIVETHSRFLKSVATVLHSAGRAGV